VVNGELTSDEREYRIGEQRKELTPMTVPLVCQGRLGHWCSPTLLSFPCAVAGMLAIVSVLRASRARCPRK
jgi:hypothetical protein